jgi:hypothetical protein
VVRGAGRRCGTCWHVRWLSLSSNQLPWLLFVLFWFLNTFCESSNCRPPVHAEDSYIFSKFRPNKFDFLFIILFVVVEFVSNQFDLFLNVLYLILKFLQCLFHILVQGVLCCVALCARWLRLLRAFVRSVSGA